MLLIAGIFIYQSFNVQPEGVEAAVGANELTGFAWSSNIGWISFNSEDLVGTTTDFAVSINPTNKKFSGYAWAETIGWINFGPSGPYPESPAHEGKLQNNDQVEGWARAVGNGDGWDGWIKLGDGGSDNDWVGNDNAQVWLDTNTCELRGFAWGGDVVGWIAFNSDDLPGSPAFAVNLPQDFCVQPPTVDITANGSDGPLTVAPGETVTIAWTSTDADSCSVSPTGWSGTSGSQDEVILSSINYTAECTNAAGSDSDSVTINLSAAIDCSPAQQTVFVGETAAFSASGGSGAYSWSAPEGDPASGSGVDFSTSFNTVGDKVVTVEDANIPGQTATCQVFVQGAPIFQEE